jgi:two-component system OmpR family sensor kinase
MDEPRWYRSLYWRMALGALAGLAGLLLAQAALFLWLAGTSDRPFLDRSPQRILRLVTLDLSGALESDPTLDLAAYVRDQFRRLPWRVYVVLPDGRVLTNRTFIVPREAVEAARQAFTAGDPTEAGPPARRGPGRGRARFGQVIAGGRVVAVVGLAAREGPLIAVFREYGVPLALAAIVLLVAGAGGMAVFVLAPVRRRLRTLQSAADALGAGDPATRAPEAGGDEVAALAKSFNHMAAELESRVHDLKESDRLRRQLLADVSHELMTPLTAMRGYLETLALPNAVPDTSTRDRYVRIVTDETLRLETIVGDLLDLARLEGGGITLDRADVPVSWLFERVSERHGVALNERHVTLERRIDPGAEHVDGDARRLEQVFQNLVANAVRHTPEGGRITLEARPAGGRVAITVSDTGPGIPPEHLPFVFDRFYKVDAARTQAGTPGSGLGLSIVRAIIERHGGTVTASSPPGGGARFEVVLDRPRD